MKVTELFESSLHEGFAIKLKDGSWYSEQQPTRGPLKGGNPHVRVFMSMNAADDFLIVQQNNKNAGRRFEDAEIKRYRKKAVNEGTFIIKSKDGVEKRFKDLDSQEAKAWKEKIAKNIKLVKYSNAYWEKKQAESDIDVMTPWNKIGGFPNDADQINQLVVDQYGRTGRTDWTLGTHGGMKRDDTDVATRELRVQFEYGPEDDMGLEEPTSDMQVILVARNPKKPKQIDFIKFIN